MKKDNSILLCGGTHNGQWYNPGFTLTEDTGITMSNGQHYTTARWPTGELVGIADMQFFDQTEEDVSPSVFEVGRAVLVMCCDLGFALVRGTFEEGVMLSFRTIDR